MNIIWTKIITAAKPTVANRMILIPLLLILSAGAETVMGSIDTGDPGTPFIGRVVNLFGYLIGMHPGKWPDKPDKKIRLQQCADILRSAIDTNQIELACSKLTNQPEAVLAIRNYSQQTISNLDEVASLLTNANLKTFTADYGEGAEIVNPKNKNEWFDFVFYYNGPVMQFSKRPLDGSHAGMGMYFFENGRPRRDAGGHFEFRENGEIDHCFINGKYILIPIATSRYVAKDAEQQRKIYTEFCQAKDPAVKDHDAHTLSNLWHDSLLDDGIKDRLTQENYHLVLQQIFSNDGVPCWEVHCSQAFPFPDVYTAFTPTLYLNGQINWDPLESQRSCSMTVTNDSLTGQTGGDLKNGDVVQYKINLTQTDRDRGRQWQISLWSNKLVLEKLKD